MNRLLPESDARMEVAEAAAVAVDGAIVQAQMVGPGAANPALVRLLRASCPVPDPL